MFIKERVEDLDCSQYAEPPLNLRTLLIENMMASYWKVGGAVINFFLQLPRSLFD